MEKILTISVAAYNAEKYLNRCLDSLIHCKEIDKLEILVINDGSSDATQTIAECYQDRYPDSIKVINKENGGHGSTVNCSIKLATGKYFKLVDADDWVDSDGLYKVIRFLEQTTVDLVLNPYTNVNEKGEITLEIPCVRSAGDVEYGRKYEINAIQNAINYETHTLMFQTDVLKRIRKPISEHCFYVDVEYSLYPMQFVHTVTFLDIVIYRYLFGTADQSMNISNMVKRRDQHLHVSKNVIRFYRACKNRTVDGKELIKYRVVGMIRSQYVIYFRMPDVKTGKKELIRFDNYVKKASPELYSDVLVQDHKKSMLLLKLLRKTKFHGCSILLRIIHIFGLDVKA